VRFTKDKAIQKKKKNRNANDVPCEKKDFAWLLFLLTPVGIYFTDGV
jgi:hypothetical protein